MGITSEEILHISHLARLEVEDINTVTSQLNKILNYFQKLQEINTEGIEPTFNPTPLSNVFRDDAIFTSDVSEKVLSGAPESDGNYFLVPRIIE